MEANNRTETNPATPMRFRSGANCRGAVYPKPFDVR